jgi:hypothetical protein
MVQDRWVCHGLYMVASFSDAEHRVMNLYCSDDSNRLDPLND